MSSPTHRTLEYIRSVLDWPVSIAERRKGPRLVDLFGWADLVALDVHAAQIVGIQVTSGDHHADRLRKVKRFARDWVLCRGRAEVWSWRKYKRPVDGKFWRPRIDVVSLEECLNESQTSPAPD